EPFAGLPEIFGDLDHVVYGARVRIPLVVLAGVPFVLLVLVAVAPVLAVLVTVRLVVPGARATAALPRLLLIAGVVVRTLVGAQLTGRLVAPGVGLRSAVVAVVALRRHAAGVRVRRGFAGVRVRRGFAGVRVRGGVVLARRRLGARLLFVRRRGRGRGGSLLLPLVRGVVAVAPVVVPSTTLVRPQPTRSHQTSTFPISLAPLWSLLRYSLADSSRVSDSVMLI